VKRLTVLLDTLTQKARRQQQQRAAEGPPQSRRSRRARRNAEGAGDGNVVPFRKPSPETVEALDRIARRIDPDEK
jgi:hypothetical protein